MTLSNEELNKILDAKIDEWHDGDSTLTLHEYLGLSWADYVTWTRDRTKLPKGWGNK